MINHIDSNIEYNDQWKKVYLFGGIATFIVFGLTLVDIVIGSMMSSNLNSLPQTAVERFSEFQDSWLIGLYHLDMLNMIISLFMIPVFIALLAVHKKEKEASVLIVLILFIVATTIFIGSNTALPMFELSNKYYSTTDPSQKILYAAAGEALLARGAHGTPGVFIGFSLLTISNICLSLVMLSAHTFRKIVGYLGIVGGFMLFVYILLVTFIPGIKNIAVMIAAPGGILFLIWYILVAIKLLKMGLEK
jgi:hypothetical protein